MKPLTHEAAQAHELGDLQGILDPLSNYVEVQRFGEFNNRTRQVGILCAARDVVDERLVHFEDIDREVAQMAQRRVSGAEVVECDPRTAGA